MPRRLLSEGTEAARHPIRVAPLLPVSMIKEQVGVCEDTCSTFSPSMLCRYYATRPNLRLSPPTSPHTAFKSAFFALSTSKDVNHRRTNLRSPVTLGNYPCRKYRRTATTLVAMLQPRNGTEPAAPAARPPSVKPATTTRELRRTGANCPTSIAPVQALRPTGENREAEPRTTTGAVAQRSPCAFPGWSMGTRVGVRCKSGAWERGCRRSLEPEIKPRCSSLATEPNPRLQPQGRHRLNPQPQRESFGV